MAEIRQGSQVPSRSHILPYLETEGEEAVRLYENTGRTAMEWQKLLMFDLLAKNDDGLWVYTKFGYSIPRRNGKSEILVARELKALFNGEKMLNTAHKLLHHTLHWSD